MARNANHQSGKVITRKFSRPVINRKNSEKNRLLVKNIAQPSEIRQKITLVPTRAYSTLDRPVLKQRDNYSLPQLTKEIPDEFKNLSSQLFIRKENPS